MLFITGTFSVLFYKCLGAALCVYCSWRGTAERHTCGRYRRTSGTVEPEICPEHDSSNRIQPSVASVIKHWQSNGSKILSWHFKDCTGSNLSQFLAFCIFKQIFMYSLWQSYIKSKLSSLLLNFQGCFIDEKCFVLVSKLKKMLISVE